MNKYQNQISLAKQPKYPHKKPAHQKKNPASHQAWLNSKKARNQAQYLKRDPSVIRCLVCYTTKLKLPFANWIEEKHYQNNSSISKEILTGDNSFAAQDNRQYLGSAYHCSLACFNWKAKQAESEDHAPGKCSACRIDLVVFNAQCKELNHQKEMQYLPLVSHGWKGGQQ